MCFCTKISGEGRFVIISSCMSTRAPTGATVIQSPLRFYTTKKKEINKEIILFSLHAVCVRNRNAEIYLENIFQTMTK